MVTYQTYFPRLQMSINDGKSSQILKVGEKKLCNLFQVIFILILEAEKKKDQRKRQYLKDKQVKKFYFILFLGFLKTRQENVYFFKIINKILKKVAIANRLFQTNLCARYSQRINEKETIKRTTNTLGDPCKKTTHAKIK